MKTFKKIEKGVNNTTKLAFAFLSIGFISMYSSLTGVQYDTVDICFKPEKINNAQNINKYCKSNDTIYRTSPKFLLEKDQDKPRQEFIQGSDKYSIPYKGRVIKNYNYATNKFYLYYAFSGAALCLMAYTLYNLATKRYKEEFPIMFEHYKIETLKAQNFGEQTRIVDTFKSTNETEYLKDGVEKEFQTIRMLDMDEESIKDYQAQLQEQYTKSKLIENKSFELQLAEISQAIAEQNYKKRKFDSGQNPNTQPLVKTNPDGTTTIIRDTINNTNDRIINDSNELMDRVVSSDCTTVIAGDPGSGKSTWINTYLSKVQTHYQDSDPTYKILSVKNDPYQGLNDKGCVTQFIGDDKIQLAREFFISIKNEYESRLKTPKHLLHTLKPYIIVLDDWLSIASHLNNIPLEELEIDFGQLLMDIIIIGRELHMKGMFILHSINLKAIGIKDLDSSTRSALNLVVTGNRYKKDGHEINAYKIMDNLLSNTQAIPDKIDRDTIKQAFKELQPVSQSNFQPLVFGYVGVYYLALVDRIQN